MEKFSQEDLFICNICGLSNKFTGAVRHRELLHCGNCQSCARFRGIIKAINIHLLHRHGSDPLDSTPERKDIRGVGMSDSACYASHLTRIFNYTNTYYHMDPRLDICDSKSAIIYRDLDFIISSDVLEHVRAPVSNALRNIYAMLKFGGKFIISVPFVEGYETVEHFPHLNEFEISQLGGTYFLVNKRIDGLVELHQNLSFHGGPGSVLEMRIFGEGDLRALLFNAGFAEIDVLTPNDDRIGYCWEDHLEYALTGGRKSKSYVMVCTKSA